MDNQAAHLYNVRILRSFAVYLSERLHWSEERLETLFRECGSHLSYLDSDDNWFGQELADRFYAVAVKMTGDSDLAYKAGAYSVNEAKKGVGGRIIQGSFSPAIAYQNIQRITEAYTKGSRYEPVRIGSGRALIRARVAEGCREQPYQCRNRLGALEAIPAVFGCTRGASDHPRCFHRGDPFCEYEFTWTEPHRYRPVPLSVAVCLVTLLLGRAWALPWWQSSALGVGLGLLSFLALRELLLTQLKTSLAEQNEGLEESVRTMSRRRDEQVLLREIARHTTEMMPIAELCQMTADLVRQKMQYDRVAVALVDRPAAVVKVQASSGYDDKLRDLMHVPTFKIRPDNSAGLFIRVVNTNAPIFERNIAKVMDQYSERTRRLLTTLGTQALIAVPIAFKGEVLGVLSIENTSSLKPLSANDMELMASLGDHIAVAITNARSFETTEAALRRAQRLEREQREAKEQFQKYVPTDVIDEQATHVIPRTHLEMKVLSVMFIDIVGFTARSESAPPETVAAMLGVYIEWINEIVTRYGGRINKIIGDGLLIYFDPAARSCVAAGRAILDSLPIVNERLRNRGHAPIAIGIGAHQGPCTIGSIGYERRLDYTLIGDTVNIAARLETLTRDWGNNTFCVSSRLRHEIQGPAISRGRIPLKGRTEAVEVFQAGGVRQSEASPRLAT